MRVISYAAHTMKERVNDMTSSSAKKTTVANAATAIVDALNARAPKKRMKAVEQPKKAVEQPEKAAPKKVSNTQQCANMILSLANDAKHTRNDIIASVSEALSALSVVTVRTMMSDLQNSKYAKRYSTHTISVDKATKIVTVASEIV